MNTLIYTRRNGGDKKLRLQGSSTLKSSRLRPFWYRGPLHIGDHRCIFETYPPDMSRGSATRKRRAQRAKQSSPDATVASEQTLRQLVRRLIKPEKEAGDEDQLIEDELEDADN